MGSSTIGSLTIHGDGNSFILENNAKKESFIVAMSLYGMDSDETEAFDFGGVVKTITVSGKYIGGSIAANKTFIDSLEALNQGAQDPSSGYPITFIDDLRGTIKVKVLDVDTSMSDAEGIEQCHWTLKLMQCSENA